MESSNEAVIPVEGKKKRKAKKPYVNRELSWLSFNGRVLQEAADPAVPLIERIRFLGIFSNNQDEFFRVRVATIRRITVLGDKGGKAVLGMKPKKVLKEIQKKVLAQKDHFETIYNSILKELRKEKIFIINEDQLSKMQQEKVKAYFLEKVRPSLVPIMLSYAPFFPYLDESSIYLGIKMKRKVNDEVVYALIEIPTHLSRFLVMSGRRNGNYIILLDDIIRFNLPEIFAAFGYCDFEAYTIKLTRDAELDMDNDISISFIERISKGVKRRDHGDLVRFIHDATLPVDLLEFLLQQLGFSLEDNLIPAGRYHNFKDFMKFPRVGSDDLFYRNMPPLAIKNLSHNESILSQIDKGDIIMHYPYNTFTYFIDLLREAAIDPTVTAIKMTVYRLADDSMIINSLINAAKNGKEVTVVMELRARFDETANIAWAKELEAAGAKVIFGIPGLKVHSKLCLVTKKEGKKIKRYTNVTTGNFNEVTANFYCDHSLLTADKRITLEVDKIFQFFENNYKTVNPKHLILSPAQTRKKFNAMISTEIRNAKAGKKAFIFLKMNNLVDKDMINKLYEASQAGVQIKLIIRSTCSLIPNVPGLSENIEAISIVDRFLEHARLFYFYNDGEDRMYMSSADWMTRNLDTRVEVSCPIYDKNIRKQLLDILNIQWMDNVKARTLEEQESNHYRKNKKRKKIRAQYEIYDYVRKLNAKK
ncbi:MAG: polyphosphate kinase 1 [Chitinophagales bacterium]|nr:polyphosphate kinase 1 [Chitinophagales bacterium]